MRKYRKNTKKLKKKIAKYICLGLVVLTAVPTYNKVEDTISSNETAASTSSSYSGSAYTEVNNNIPDFTQEELNITNSYEYYSDLDSLGRCQAAEACIGKDLMPTEKRGAIGMVKPTGWHTVKYDKTTNDTIYIHNNVFQNLTAGVGTHMYTPGSPHKNIRMENNRFSACRTFAVRA